MVAHATPTLPSSITLNEKDIVALADTAELLTLVAEKAGAPTKVKEALMTSAATIAIILLQKATYAQQSPENN